MQEWIVYGHKDRCNGKCTSVQPDYIWIYHTLHPKFVEDYGHFFSFSKNYVIVDITLFPNIGHPQEPLVQNVDEYTFNCDLSFMGINNVTCAVISLDTVGEWF